eukprot:gene29703-5138_t
MSPHLVPITRELLKEFYSNYPLDPVPEEEYQNGLKALAELSSEIGKTGSNVPETIGMECPTRIDDCMWKNRMFCEEMAETLGKISNHSLSDDACKEKCLSMSEKLLGCERTINKVQIQNTEAAGKQVKRFLPQDFRGSLLEMKRNSGERYYTKQIEDLVKKGGSIRDKYELYLQQQWERRESLAQLGELSGMFKFLVKSLGGIPQVLLDFAKQINAKLGPMEEQRLKYGPDMYKGTSLGIDTDVCIHLLLENLDSLDTARLTATLFTLGGAVDFYTHHIARVVVFLGHIFEKSPFFVDENAVLAKKEEDLTPVLNKKDEGVTSVSGRQLHIPSEEDSSLANCHSGSVRRITSMASDTYQSCIDHSWADNEQSHELNGFDHPPATSLSQSHEVQHAEIVVGHGAIATSAKDFSVVQNTAEQEVDVDGRSSRDMSSLQPAQAATASQAKPIQEKPSQQNPKDSGCCGCFGGSS